MVWIRAGAVNGLLAVACGAFAAHGLKAKLSPEMLAVFETAARYQMYHALALLAVGWLGTQRPGGPVAAAGWAFLAGIVIFSGSLYVYSCSALVFGETLRAAAMITPVGGALMLAGWALLAAAAPTGSRS